MSPTVREFLRLPRNQRPEALIGYEPSIQVEVFVAGLSGEPPDLGLIEPLAQQGELVVPAITERLRLEEDDWTILGLFRVLERMEMLGTYPVSADAELLELMEERVPPAASLFSDNAEEILEGLREASADKP